MVVFGIKRLYSGKVVLFGQSSCNRARVVVFGQIGCNRAIWLYSDRVFFFAKKKGLYLSKMVVFEQKLLFSDKSDCIKAKWLEA